MYLHLDPEAVLAKRLRTFRDWQVFRAADAEYDDWQAESAALRERIADRRPN